MNYKVSQIVTLIEEMVSTADKVPDYKSIHDKLGSGSYTTIKKALDEYRRKHAPAVKLSAAPDLPAKLLNRIGKVANDIWLEARADCSQEREQLTLKLHTLQQKYEELRSKAEIREILDNECKEGATLPAPRAKTYMQLAEELETKKSLINKAAHKIKQLNEELERANAELAQLRQAASTPSV